MPGEKALDERGLADSRCAGHPDYGPLAATRAVPRPLQAREFRGTAHERRGLGLVDLRGVAPGRSGCRQRRRFRDEPVAAARDRFDVSRLARVVRKDAPQIADGGLQAPSHSRNGVPRPRPGACACSGASPGGGRARTAVRRVSAPDRSLARRAATAHWPRRAQTRRSARAAGGGQRESWVRTLHRTLTALGTTWALDCEASSAASS